MAYDIRITPAAERGIGKSARQRLRCEKLENSPRTLPGRLREGEVSLAQYGVFRVRVGKDYRILYQVEPRSPGFWS